VYRAECRVLGLGGITEATHKQVQTVCIKCLDIFLSICKKETEMNGCI